MALYRQFILYLPTQHLKNHNKYLGDLKPLKNVIPDYGFNMTKHTNSPLNSYSSIVSKNWRIYFNALIVLI